MGYYTDYRIRVSKKSDVKDVDLDVLILDLEQVTGGYHFDYEGRYLSLQEAKWYDHEDDLRKLTSQEKYKDVLLEIRGDGEEHGDTWMAIARNGVFLRGDTKIVYRFGELEVDAKDFD